jgi:hypothetical protein
VNWAVENDQRCLGDTHLSIFQEWAVVIVRRIRVRFSHDGQRSSEHAIGNSMLLGCNERENQLKYAVQNTQAQNAARLCVPESVMDLLHSLFTPVSLLNINISISISISINININITRGHQSKWK